MEVSYIVYGRPQSVGPANIHYFIAVIAMPATSNVYM